MAHTKTYYVLVLFLTFFFVGCKKMSKEYTTVEFIVVNPANGEPFVGMPVKLMEESGKSFGSSGKEIFEAVTDANGRASVTFRAKKGSDTWYYPYIKDEILGVSGFDFAYLKRPYMSSYFIKKDKYNEARYEITYFGYLHEKFVNKDCEGITDSVFIKVIPSLQYGSKSLIRNIKYTGCDTHETEGGKDGDPPGYFQLFMGWNRYEYTVKRTSGTTSGKDSVYIEKSALNQIEIKY